MKRTSPYYPLKYVVHCKPSGQHFFEVIAAFNDNRIATGYTNDCCEHKMPGWRYEVRERKGNKWVTIDIKET